MIVSILLPIFRHVFECINLILTMFFFFDFFVAPTTICVSVLINAFFYFDGIKKNPITLALNCYCCSSCKIGKKCWLFFLFTKHLSVQCSSNKKLSFVCRLLSGSRKAHVTTSCMTCKIHLLSTFLLTRLNPFFLDQQINYNLINCC